MDISRRLKHTRAWFWILSILTVILLAIVLLAYPNYYEAKLSGNQNMTDIFPSTTRLPGQDAFEVAISVAQNIYPATFKDNKPGAVILVPVDDWQTAVLAAEIVHFPINAPILYSEREQIPKETLDEIKRLDPEGIFQDQNHKVLLIGDFGPKVKEQLKKEKLKFRELKAKSTEQMASLLDDYKAMIHVDHDDEIIIVPKDNPAYAIIPTSWVAHAGHSIFFVDKNGVSKETKKSLAKRPQDAFIYVIGDDEAIPPHVRVELSKYGHVQKIPGKDPNEVAIGFASYIDFGRNFGWWIRRTNRMFGWGIGEAGHNFTFVNPNYPELAIPAAALSHMGKHGPFLFVPEEKFPKPVQQYLQKVQPSFTSSQEQLFNHGWVIGDDEFISTKLQGEIDDLLQVKGF